MPAHTLRMFVIAKPERRQSANMLRFGNSIQLTYRNSQPNSVVERISSGDLARLYNRCFKVRNDSTGEVATFYTAQSTVDASVQPRYEHDIKNKDPEVE